MDQWYEELDFEKNPFSVNPSYNLKTIVGREKILDEVDYRIKSGSLMFLEGELGLGKTSILRLIIKKYRGKGQIIFVDCEKLGDNLNIEELLVNRNGLIKGKLMKKYPKNMILLIDNVSELSSVNTERIKYFFDEGYLKSVIFTGESYEAVNFSDSLRQRMAKVEALPSLNSYQVVDMVRKRFGNSKFISDAVIEKVSELSNSNPKQTLVNLDSVCEYVINIDEDCVSLEHVNEVLVKPAKAAEEEVKKVKAVEAKTKKEEAKKAQDKIESELKKEAESKKKTSPVKEAKETKEDKKEETKKAPVKKEDAKAEPKKETKKEVKKETKVKKEVADEVGLEITSEFENDPELVEKKEPLNNVDLAKLEAEFENDPELKSFLSDEPKIKELDSESLNDLDLNKIDEGSPKMVSAKKAKSDDGFFDDDFDEEDFLDNTKKGVGSHE